MNQIKQFIIIAALFGGVVILNSSCSFIETDPVTVPSYLYVPFANFSTVNKDPVIQGDSTSKFVDVWIYDNGTLLGNIGYPAIIPIQKTGLTEIELDAGILKSGQDYERIPYPFTERQVFKRNLVANKVDTLIPTFKYLANTKFSVIEGFEPSELYDLSYNPNNAQTDSIVRVNGIEAMIPGRYSCKVVMSPSTYKFELNSGEFEKEKLQPSPASPVYLEIDYKSDYPIYIGMYSRTPQGIVQSIPEFQTNPTGVWNKVYICLDQDISPAQYGTLFKLFIGVINADGGQPHVYLDNIKLVHF